MKLSCGVVRDLLPLYAEELTGEESGRLVREHLADCPDCRERLAALQSPRPTPEESAGAMRALKKSIRNRRLRTAALAALTVFLLLFTLLARALSERLLPYDEDLIHVEGVRDYDAAEPYTGALTELPAGEEQGEALFLRFDGRVRGIQSETITDEGGGTTLYLQAWTDSLGAFTGGAGLRGAEGGRYVSSPVPDRVIYGYGNEQVLLYGEAAPGGAQILPRLVLGYYAVIAAGLLPVLGLLWLLFRGKKAETALRQLFLAAASYLAGQLLVKGTVTTSFFLMKDLLFILLTAAAVYGLLTLLWQSLRQRRADRAD